MKIFNTGNRIVNNYIVQTGKGYVVIDTGYPGNYAKFLKRLQKLSITLSLQNNKNDKIIQI